MISIIINIIIVLGVVGMVEFLFRTSVKWNNNLISNKNYDIMYNQWMTMMIIIISIAFIGNIILELLLLSL